MARTDEVNGEDQQNTAKNKSDLIRLLMVYVAQIWMYGLLGEGTELCHSQELVPRNQHELT